jgi:hypothetical protein
MVWRGAQRPQKSDRGMITGDVVKLGIGAMLQVRSEKRPKPQTRCRGITIATPPRRQKEKG